MGMERWRGRERKIPFKGRAPTIVIEPLGLVSEKLLHLQPAVADHVNIGNAHELQPAVRVVRQVFIPVVVSDIVLLNNI